MASQSLRMTRTTGNKLSESSEQYIRQSLSDPMNLKKASTDESSVFSGLNSIINDADGETQVFKDEYIRRTEKSRKKTSTLDHSKVGNYALKGIFDSISEEEEAREKELIVERPGASSQDFLYNQDASTMSYGSVNEFQRSAGVMKLVSNIHMMDGTDSESKNGEDCLELGSPPTPEGSEEITNLFKAFERELDANLSEIADDDNNNAEHDDSSPTSPDILSRGVHSHENPRYSSNHQSKELQSLLQQTRKEVEVLKETKEQLMSEIEQTEEEHKSEIKLVEERAKQKLHELKAMHQEEIDCLTQEKDAAIVEAGRQATQYVAGGRKQISTLKKQVEMIKLHTFEAVKKGVTEAAAIVKAKKDEEMTSRIEALRQSHESKLEQLRIENEKRVKNAIDEALASRNQPSEDEAPDIGPSTKSEAYLRRKEEAMLKALLSVKEHLNKRYPMQMESLGDKTRHTSNSRALPRIGDHDESPSEIVFKEVVEAFAHLLEESERKIASTQAEAINERAKKERNEIYIQARRDLIAKHRAELDYTRHQLLETVNKAAEFKESFVRLQQDLKIVFKEKRALQERFRRDAETHQSEVERLQEKIRTFEKTERQSKPIYGKRDRRKARNALGAFRGGGQHPATTSEQCEKGHDAVVDQQSNESVEDFDIHTTDIPSFEHGFSGQMQINATESLDKIESMRSPSSTFEEQIDTSFDGSSIASHEYHRETNRVHMFQYHVEGIPGMLTLSPPAPPPPPPPSPSLAMHRMDESRVSTGNFDPPKMPSIYSGDGGVSYHDSSPDEMKEGQDLGEQGKKKKFGLLRGIKAIRSGSPANTRSAIKAGRVGKIRNFFDTIGRSDSSHRRKQVFLDGSDRSSRSVKVSLEEDRPRDDDNDAVSTGEEPFSEHARSSMRKKNPRGVFTKKTRPSLSAEAGEENVVQDNDDDIESGSKQGILLPAQPSQRLHDQLRNNADEVSQGDRVSSLVNEFSSHAKRMHSEPTGTTKMKSIEEVSSVIKEDKGPSYSDSVQSTKQSIHSNNCGDKTEDTSRFLPLAQQSDEDVDGDDSTDYASSIEEIEQDENENSLNVSPPSVVQEHSISFKPSLSSFKPPRVDTEKSSTPTGCQTKTAGTVNTLRSLYETDSNKLRELGRRSLSSPHGASSSRRASTVAALKARRARRQSGE
jgi:hypothetical protein